MTTDLEIAITALAESVGKQATATAELARGTSEQIKSIDGLARAVVAQTTAMAQVITMVRQISVDTAHTRTLVDYIASNTKRRRRPTTAIIDPLASVGENLSQE